MKYIPSVILGIAYRWGVYVCTFVEDLGTYHMHTIGDPLTSQEIGVKNFR